MKSFLIFCATLLISAASFAQSGVYFYGELANSPGYPVDITATVYSNPPVTAMLTADEYGQINATWIELPSNDWTLVDFTYQNCENQTSYDTFQNNPTDSIIDFFILLDYCENLGILGCTDPEANNYDPSALLDDGSCLYDATCTEVTAALISNWGAEGDWILYQNGNLLEAGTFNLTDTLFNFCLEDGCFDLVFEPENGPQDQLFYNLLIEGNFVSGGSINNNTLFFGVNENCGVTVYGCTDPEANNYNPNANLDDGSCEFDVTCTEIELILDGPSGFQGEWYLYGNNTLIESGNYSGSDATYFFCLEDGCYDLAFSGFGVDSLNQVSYSLFAGGAMLDGGTFFYETNMITFGVNADCGFPIFGCTNPNAVNYNPLATVDDGSCEFGEPAENDLCADATPLILGTQLIDNSNAFNNENIWGDCWAFGSGEGEQSSIWFTFTTPDYPAIIHIEASGDGSNTFTDTQFGLFEECGGEMIYCDGNAGQGLFSAFNFNCGDLAEGTTYILMVDGFYGDSGTCNLTYTTSQGCQDIYGCTDPDAINYNPNANIDDGSCEFDVTCDLNEVTVLVNPGPWANEVSWNLVLDSLAIAGGGNYTSNATVQYDLCLEDGCYIFEMYDSFGDGWNGATFTVIMGGETLAFGTLNSGSYGAFFFGINTEGCGANENTYGCTDPSAINFDPQATIDDGSCIYQDSCLTNTVEVIISTAYSGDEVWWSILQDSTVVAAGNGYGDMQTYAVGICLEDGCYTFEMHDLYGDGWNGGTFSIFFDGYTVAYGTLQDGSYGAITFGINADDCDEVEDIYGCTDPNADNYNPNATIDDGSCEYMFSCSISFTVSPDTTGAQVIWITPSNNISDAVEVLWDFGDGSTSTDLFPTHSYAGDGPYELCLTAYFVNPDGSTCTITHCAILTNEMINPPGMQTQGFSINVVDPSGTTGFEENLLAESVSLYPNPATDKVSLSYELAQSSTLNISLFDSAGRCVLQNTVEGAQGLNHQFIPVESLTPGLYLVHLSGAQISTTVRLVKK